MKTDCAGNAIKWKLFADQDISVGEKQAALAQAANNEVLSEVVGLPGLNLDALLRDENPVTRIELNKVSDLPIHNVDDQLSVKMDVDTARFVVKHLSQLKSAQIKPNTSGYETWPTLHVTTRSEYCVILQVFEYYSCRMGSSADARGRMKLVYNASTKVAEMRLSRQRLLHRGRAGKERQEGYDRLEHLLNDDAASDIDEEGHVAEELSL